MATAGRLAGAIILKSRDKFFLIGDFKEPFDFSKNGFQTPSDWDPKKNPVQELSINGDFNFEDLRLALEPDESIEDEELAKKLARVFIIERNASVSERLWNLVVENSSLEGDIVAARWVAETPDLVWEAVRRTVLSC